MKKASILNVVLAAALVAVCAFTSVRCGHKGGSSSEATATDGKAAIENLMTRSSVRSYSERTVSEATIDTLLRAGMAAPSAVNKQPWHFVVVDDKAQLAKIAELTPNSGMAANAPLAIVVCADMDKTLDGQAKEFWVQDVSAATENILLAAHAVGLGSVWTGLWPDRERSAKISQLMQLPQNMVAFCTIVLGYPDGEPQVKDKYNADNISHNHYGGKSGEASTAAAPAPERKELKAFDVKHEFRENPFNYFMKNGGLLLCAGDQSATNAMTIGWGGLGVLWGKTVATVYVAEGRYTHGVMEKTKYFTIMEFKDPKIAEYMGSHSGRDGNKAEALGLHVKFTDNGAPYYEEADAVIECRLMYKAPFAQSNFTDDVPRKFYDGFKAGLHSEYIGEVVGAMRR